MNIEQTQINTLIPNRQPSVSKFANPLELPRYERWASAQSEIDALPHTLGLSEFKTAQEAIWARWGL